MISFRQYFEAVSPEYKRRAGIISGLDNYHFNISEKSFRDGTNEVHVDLISLNNIFSHDYDEVFVGGCHFNKQANPTAIHINLESSLRGKGIGGMLYEIALELATANGQSAMISGAISNRYTSTHDAYRTWDHYFKNRTDIIPIPFSDYAKNNVINSPTGAPVSYTHLTLPTILLV